LVYCDCFCPSRVRCFGFCDLCSVFAQLSYSVYPKGAGAILIMFATLVAANFLRRLVAASVASAKMAHAKGLSALSWWVVFIFGFFAALAQVGVASRTLETLITGLIAMLALAGGLAFGLGGKEHASRFLDKIREDMRSH